MGPRDSGGKDGGGSRRAPEAEPIRSRVFFVSFRTQNRVLCANNRIAIVNRDSIRGAFCIYSDRDPNQGFLKSVKGPLLQIFRPGPKAAGEAAPPPAISHASLRPLKSHDAAEIRRTRP
jgi:hypothetical protein